MIQEVTIEKAKSLHFASKVRTLREPSVGTLRVMSLGFKNRASAPDKPSLRLSTSYEEILHQQPALILEHAARHHRLGM